MPAGRASLQNAAHSAETPSIKVSILVSSPGGEPMSARTFAAVVSRRAAAFAAGVVTSNSAASMASDLGRSRAALDLGLDVLDGRRLGLDIDGAQSSRQRNGVSGIELAPGIRDLDRAC